MSDQSHEDTFRQQRIEHMNALNEAGYAPFGGVFERTGTLAEIRAGFVEGQVVRLAGRIVAIREMGKSVFMHLQDATGRFQVYVRKDVIGEDAFKAVKLLDLGDHIGVEGEEFVTKMGEPTIKVTGWTMLSKALRPLPAKWHGLQDVEIRYRQRYLDLIANADVCRVFQQRSLAIKAIRDALYERGFLEVETPMMQSMAGGAAATPFETYYEALSAPMYLRIAPELYLKRLLVGGYDKVFELNRNFRNEGLSRFHNPEFTMLEIYQAFGNVRTMMTLVTELITGVAESVYGKTVFGEGEAAIDLGAPWREVPYRDLVRERAGADWFALDLAGMRERAESLGCSIAPEWDVTEVTQEVFEKLIEKTLIQPTFVTRLPKALVPLAKTCVDDPDSVDVFELIIGGREIAPGYEELNDPLEQRARFEAQAGGDAERIDEEFLLAMEHGMPPAGGMGIGIDRLVMILSEVEAIRDVILFPQLKRRAVPVGAEPAGAEISAVSDEGGSEAAS
jgi:lysyl-tRNA synthetase, class II